MIRQHPSELAEFWILSEEAAKMLGDLIEG
jgi:hypothetical protein